MAGDHKCPVCSATFTRPQHVARHMRSHTGDRPYKCQHCGDQFARSDLLSRHVNKCHASEKPPTTTAPNRRKGSASASRATTSKQACDQCVVTNLPCDGSNPCSKCISRKCRCTYVKFHRQTAPVGPGHPAPSISSTEKTSQHPHFSVDAIMPSDEYLLTQPQNPTVPLSNMGSVGIYHHNTMPATEFTFPAPMYSRSSSLPVNTTVTNSQSAPDQTSPDFAIRYRAQAELLSRAGVLPHSQITLPSSVGQGSAHSNSRIGLGLNSGIATQSSQHQSYNSDQRYSLSSASWGNGRQPQEPMNGIIYHSSRPNSQAGYPGSLPNNSASSAPDLYDFRYANRDSVDDLSDSTSASTSELGHSEHGHSSDHSFYDSPSIPQTVPTNLIISGQKPSSEHHEGFSSAFGLMSLDDPNVLAGIASDGTPFFSNINGNGQSEMNTIPQHMRDDAMAGICLKPLSTKLDGLNELNGNVGGGSTPRETELRELRDFWKQYMRTPLSGPNGSGPTTNSFPLATPTPNNLHGHGQLEEQTGKHSPTKKLSRVSSLPSVKTPPSHSEVGPLGHPPANSQHIYHAIVSNETGRSNIAADPSRAGTYIHTQMGEDDLKSYEQAVLARKTPTLNLVPRKRPTTANTVDSSSFGRFSNPSTASSSPVVPQQSLGGAGRTSSLSDPATSSRPSSADSDESDRGAVTRPSFKRLPSTTLGPPNSKRALLSVSRHEWSSTSDAEALRVTEGSDADCGGGILRGVFISEPSSTMADTPVQAVAAREKHRRLSAPVATNSLR